MVGLQWAAVVVLMRLASVWTPNEGELFEYRGFNMRVGMAPERDGMPEAENDPR